jgi:hypothetical protein
MQRAKQLGLSVLSITDHDNVAGIDEATEVGKTLGIDIVPGVELSVAIREKDIHVLAYYFDHTNQELLDYLGFIRRERFRRARRIVEKLNKIGVPLRFDTVLAVAGDASIGRPHIANALVDEGLTETYHEAFVRYIGTNGPAYEKKFMATAQDVLGLINRCRGLTFLAHPSHYTSDFELNTLIQNGIDGIEVVHPSHTEQRVQFYRSLVNQYFLLESGGSDLHGGKKGDEHHFGVVTVSLPVVEAMKNRLFS